MKTPLAMSKPLSLTLATTGLGLFFWGCGFASPPSGTRVLHEENATSAQIIGEDSGSTAAPLRFGLGRSPTLEEIERWNIDVMPDGEGLPEGSGSVADGHDLYVEKCQSCHGVGGTGGPFDVLVGRQPEDGFPFAVDPEQPRTIGSYWPYATTLFDYTRRAMPLDRPGSLEDDEVYALTAFLLHLNGLLDSGASLDRESLPRIEMPAVGRFVRDRRRGGQEIR